MRLEKRILIVDDDDAIRALVTTILRRRGLTADGARNGAEAMEQLKSCRYSLVVLDLMMPRMSGYEMLEQLSAMSPEARPLVLILTAGLVLKPLDLSFVVGTIQKPFDVRLILDTVTGCLEASAPISQPDPCGEPQVPASEKAN
jgi:DNA-binding response OmpR family regulator